MKKFLEAQYTDAKFQQGVFSESETTKTTFANVLAEMVMGIKLHLQFLLHMNLPMNILLICLTITGNVSSTL